MRPFFLLLLILILFPITFPSIKNVFRELGHLLYDIFMAWVRTADWFVHLWMYLFSWLCVLFSATYSNLLQHQSSKVSLLLRYWWNIKWFQGTNVAQIKKIIRIFPWDPNAEVLMYCKGFFYILLYSLYSFILFY